MKSCVRTRFLALVTSILVGVAFGVQTSSGPIQLGEWNTNFSAGLNYANEHHVPMLLFWSNPGCGNCGNLNRALSTSTEFMEWQDKRKLVMIFSEGGASAKEFARNSTGAYPYMSVYWNRDGETIEKHNFSGLTAYFPVTQDSTGAMLPYAMQLAASVDYYLADYQVSDFAGGRFKTGSSAGNRLEAVPGVTERVMLPLVRELAHADEEVDVTFEVDYAGKGTNESYVIHWDVGGRNQTIELVLQATAKLAVGDQILLKLVDATGVPQAQTVIACVGNDKAGLSPSDPLWLGEEFRFGRFTFDYAAATQAVEAEHSAGRDAYTLALFTGALWCPYCLGMEGSLLSDPRFYAWAESNRVALVEFDQGRASSPSTAAGTLAPRLLTYEPDPNKSGEDAVSGASYLSRHSVSPTDAEAVLNRTTRYTQEWLAPESTAARLSQPTFLLIKNDRVVGRFLACRDDERRYDVDENLARLDDFLHLAVRDDERGDYRTTTTNVHQLGTSERLTLQISDGKEFYKLAGVAAGQLGFTLQERQKSIGDIVFRLYQGKELLSVGTNVLEAAVSAERAAKGDFALGVSAYDESVYRTTFAPRGASGSTVVEVGFASRLVLLPEDRSVTATAQTSEVTMKVTEGEEYRLIGFTAESLAGSFQVRDAELGIYTATRGGEVALVVDATEKITYQAWHPGRVGFVRATLTIREGEVGVQPISLERLDGGSGRLVVSVRLDTKASDLTAERYAWVDDQVMWEDGESGIRSLDFKLKDDVVYDENLQFAHFEASVDEGLEVDASAENLKLIVTVLEDDQPVAGRVAIVATDPAFAAKMSVVAREGSDLTVCVDRLVGAEREVSAQLVADGGVWLSGSERMTWAHHDRQALREAMLRLPVLKDCPTGKVTVELKPSGLLADSQRKTLTVHLIPASAPGFMTPILELQGHRHTQMSGSVVLTNVVAGAALALTKVSGALPPGLSQTLNRSEGSIAFAGAPTQAGVFEAVYRLSQTVAGVTESGDVLTVRLMVDDPVESEINTSVETCRTIPHVPMIARTAKQLAGVITVTIPISGRVSAKYRSRRGTAALVASSWDRLEEDGTLVAVAKDRLWNTRATVSAHPDGSVDIAVEDPEYPGEEVSAYANTATTWSSENPATAWRGQYTVACIREKPVTGNAGAAATGGAVFTLKMTTPSAIASGRMVYAGYLPDGRPISGSTVLAASADGQSALLPIFETGAYDLFTVPMTIAAGAADAYAAENEETRDPLAQRTVTSAGLACVWEHANEVTEYCDYAAEYAVYGSYFDPEQNLAAALVATDVLPSLKVAIDSESIVTSEDFGALGTLGATVVTVSDSALQPTGPMRLSYDKSTGLVTGSVDLPYACGKVRATFRGVVLPGWTGCGCIEGETDLPFVTGALRFADGLYFQEDWQSCSESNAPYVRVSVVRGCSVSFMTTANPVQ